MIAAIYARKSTEQIGVSEDQKSVTRQIEHASAYAKKKGWRVAEEHVYSDDGISGAEFEKRPGFIRLMNALKPKPPFQVLIMSEESRLGREQYQTSMALLQICDAGVQVWLYLNDQQRRLDTPTDKLMLSIHTFGGEFERAQAQVRAYDALLKKARAGHVTGGKVFGYDNITVNGAVPDAQGNLTRSHTELRINVAEADVVRTLFRLYADGHGFTTIAKTLNAEGALCPRPRPLTKPRGWAPSSVRQVLLSRLYKGEQVWGRTKKRAPSGVRKVRRRPEQEWIVVPVPHLQIVPPALWQEAQTRWKHVRKLYLRATNGLLHGRPTNGHESPYLLTGFTACKTCAGSLIVQSESRKGRRAFFYACATHCRRGAESCAEVMLSPMEALDRAILGTLEQEVLHPAIISKAIEKALQQLRPQENDDPDVRRQKMLKDLEHVGTALDRLAQAVAEGGTLATLLALIRKQEERRTLLEAELATLDGLIAAPFNPARIEHELRTYLKEWSGLAQRHPAQARQILRKLLPSRIRVWREVREGEKVYLFEGEAALGNFFNGIAHVEKIGVPNGI